MEKFTSFKRVAGAKDEAHEQMILDNRADVFRDQDFSKLKRVEKVKTPEEKTIINMVDAATNKVLEKYGVRGFSIPENNIHIVPEAEWPEEYDSSAIYSALNQAVVIKEDSVKVVLLKKVFHEMLHFKSYNALQINDDADQRIDQYRVGLTVVNRKGERRFFAFINEAVTEELTKQYVKELLEDPMFLEENQRTAETIDLYRDTKTSDGEPLFDEEVFYAEAKKDDLREGFVNLEAANFSYVKERAFLNKLIDKLYQLNSGDFKSRQEVFDVFAKAALSGNLLTVGKLIDRTLGQGTFRKIGEMDTDEVAKSEMFDLVER